MDKETGNRKRSTKGNRVGIGIENVMFGNFGIVFCV
jgi:hypothetical protein